MDKPETPGACPVEVPLTEHDHEVSPKLPLCFDGQLWRERLDGAVMVALEPCSLLADADKRRR